MHPEQRGQAVIEAAIILPVLVIFGTTAMPKTYKVTATMWVDSPAALQRNQQGQLQTASALEAQACGTPLV